jgi:hypothetical protein
LPLIVGVDRPHRQPVLHHRGQERVDVVDRLAQVDRHVLALAGALAPDRRGAHRRRHRRQRHRRADAEVAAQDRVAAGEGDCTSAIVRRAAEVGHEGGEGGVDVEGGVLGICPAADSGGEGRGRKGRRLEHVPARHVHPSSPPIVG